MKMRKYVTGLVGGVVLVGLFCWNGFAGNAGAETNSQKVVGHEDSGMMSTVQKEFSEEKAEFKKKAKEKLAEFDKGIKELEGKAKKTGAHAEAEAKEALQDLKEKRKALKKELKKLDKAGEETWEAAKQKFSDAEGAVQKAYDKAASYFKSE